MTTERAEKLQANITKEAIAMLVIHGNAFEPANYEKAVSLIGEAWALPDEDTEQCLTMIEQEKNAISTAATPKDVVHVLPESELPMNATGMETLDNVWDLFETVVRLDTLDKRKHLFQIATELADCQNLLDWIEKTDAEKELPELADAGSQAQELA